MKHWINWQRPARACVVLAVSAVMSACGGGGGGDPAPSGGGSPAGASSSLSGVASKGLLKNALVRVFSVLPGGVVGAQIGGTIRTDDAGRYRFTGLPVGTLVYVEVEADALTRMADEATGSEIQPPLGFKLRAARVLGEGEDTLQVTPFSDMAVAIAIKSGGLTPDIVAAANQKIVAYVGAQVLTVPPAFGSDGKPTNAVALTLAAVSQMAKNGFPGCAPVGAAQADKVSCVVEKMALQGPHDGTLAQLLETARDQLKPGYQGLAPAPLAVQSPHLATLPVVGGIAEAKTLFASLRNNLADDVTDTVAKRLRKVAEELANSVSPLNDGAGDLVVGVARAVAVLKDPAGELGAFQSPHFGPELSDGRGRACTLFSDAAGTVPATSYVAVNAVRCAADMGGSGYSTSGASSSSSGGMAFSYSRVDTFDMADIKVSKGAAGDVMAVETQHYSQELTQTWPADGPYSRVLSSKLWAGPAYQALATLKPTASGAPYGAFTLRGDLLPGPAWQFASGDKRTVDLAVGVGPLPAGVGAIGLRERATRLSLAGSIGIVAQGEPGVSIALLSGSHVDAYFETVGDVTSGVDGNRFGFSVVNLSVDIVAPSGARIEGRLIDTTDFLEIQGQLGPRAFRFAGAVKQSDGLPLFAGEVSLKAPFDEKRSVRDNALYAGGEVVLKGSLDMTAERRALQVNLSVILGGTSLVHSFAGSYVQGSTTVLLEGTYAETAGATSQLKLSTPSGVTIQGSSSDAAFLVTQGAAVLGEFTRGNGRILYADGSYEQF